MTTSDVSVHLLRPAPPVRAFLVAAVATVAGAVLIVATLTFGWPVVVAWLGGLLVALGLVLLALGVVALMRLRVRAELTPSGYSFRTPGGVRHGTWADTTEVRASDGGHHLTLVHRDGAVDHVLTPQGHDDPALGDLIQDLTRRLEGSRGR